MNDDYIDPALDLDEFAPCQELDPGEGPHRIRLPLWLPEVVHREQGRAFRKPMRPTLRLTFLRQRRIVQMFIRSGRLWKQGRRWK